MCPRLAQLEDSAFTIVISCIHKILLGIIQATADCERRGKEIVTEKLLKQKSKDNLKDKMEYYLNYWWTDRLVNYS